MNRAKLKQVLDNEGIRADAYDLEGGDGSERYNLRECNGVWDVYYSERGIESGLRRFSNEQEACVHLLNLLREDSSTHTGE